jgi:hypothetical protein
LAFSRSLVPIMTCENISSIPPEFWTNSRNYLAFSRGGTTPRGARCRVM